MSAAGTVHGVVVVDKPGGMTSHDVVHRARKLFRTKRVGHTGTLDPDATGVLVLCLGNATRVAEYLSASQKNYIAEVRFGIETDTQDASGQVTAERDASHLTEAQIRELLPRFRGSIRQVPPMVSALHHQGRRLYELAREGITVERAARPVEIARLELLEFQPGPHPVATIEVTCSTGTYIRALAADIGAEAGTGAMMRSLRRTWVGEPGNAFTLAQAETLEALEKRAENGTLPEAVLPLSVALAGWPQATVTEEQEARLRSGQAIPMGELRAGNLLEASGVEANKPVAARNESGEVIAIARVTAGRLQPEKVFAQP